MTISFHAVVQHSGFGYSGNPQFSRGLESRRITTAGERDKVLREGGVLFDSYTQAEDYCMEEMYRTYPQGAFALTPRAPGSFSKHVVDGLRIYVPAEKPESPGLVPDQRQSPPKRCEQTVVVQGQPQMCDRPLGDRGYCDRPSEHVDES